MCPHNTVTHVTSFPPAELPAFTGTMTPSDFPRPVCLSPFIIDCPAYSLCSKRAEDLPGYRIFAMSDMLWSQTRRGTTDLPFASGHVDFRIHKYVIPLD